MQIACFKAAAGHCEDIFDHTCLLHGECNKARCNKARTTTRAYCYDNADGDQNGNDRAAAHDADLPGAGHTDTYGDDDADGENSGNHRAGSGGILMTLTIMVLTCWSLW